MKRYKGKLWGAAIGFSFGGPLGAIIGTAVGHLIDTSDTGGSFRVDTEPASPRGATQELTFITSLIFLLVGTARSDGSITVREIEAIKAFFRNQLGYRKVEYFIIDRIIDATVGKYINLSEACADITRRTSYEERLFLIRLGYQVAVSDGPLNQSEEDFIRKAATHLGIEEYDLLLVRGSFVRNQTGGKGGSPSDTQEKPDPYSVLGLKPDCSVEEIQRAYRNLARKYHPDRVLHLGHEFVQLAGEKFKAISEAYELIKQQRGFS
ncbi:MAG: TerB family tellurite resistance protein [Spirochaetota bacterium]